MALGPPTESSPPPRVAALVVLLAISVFINYVDRGNLAIAAPMLKDELSVSSIQLGVLLSAFFWTYACLQPVTGWLVDRLNVYWLLAAGFFLWSAATAATGFVQTFTALFALRLMLGIGESVAYPSYSKIIALNVPEGRRGLANSAVSAGLALGPGFGMLAGGMLMARFGWRSVFVALGVLSWLWLVPWVAVVPKGRVAIKDSAVAPPTLSEFLRLRSAWGTCIGLFCANCVNYFLITWLPFLLVRERQLSMDHMAQVGGTAYLLAAAAATAAGWASDRLIRAGASQTLVRKSVVAGGLALSGTCLGLCEMGGTGFGVVMIMLGVMFFGASSSNIYAITQTLAGAQAAGRWTGFQNCIGNLAGVVFPPLTGWAVQRTGDFTWAVAILAGFALVGVLSITFLVGPVEPVRWGRHLASRAAATGTAT